MKKNKRILNIFQRISSCFMIMALLWLTISAPFVFAGQQEIVNHDKISNSNRAIPEEDGKASNPFANTTEEKNPGTNSLSEEYIHDHHKTDHTFSFSYKYTMCDDVAIYTAFHGELLVPPPNIA